MRRKSIEAELTALDEECRRLGPGMDGDVEELRQSIVELRSAGMPLGMKEQFLRLLSSLVEMAKCQREFDRLETEISATAKRLEISEKKEKRLQAKRKTR